MNELFFLQIFWYLPLFSCWQKDFLKLQQLQECAVSHVGILTLNMFTPSYIISLSCGLHSLSNYLLSHAFNEFCGPASLPVPCKVCCYCPTNSTVLDSHKHMPVITWDLLTRKLAYKYEKKFTLTNTYDIFCWLYVFITGKHTVVSVSDLFITLSMSKMLIW